MKKSLLFPCLFALGFLAVGCVKNEISESSGDGAKQYTEFNHVTLEFDSEETMNSAVMTLTQMTDDERQAWYAKRNPSFVCQQDAMWIVVGELETVQNEEQLRECQKKYSGIFIFNPNEEEADISPYIPHDVPGISLVCNAYGEVSIAGRKVNYNTFETYAETDYAQYFDDISRGVQRSLNRLYIETKERKMWAEASWGGAGKNVYIRYVAHKKTLFGWNKYKTDYHVTDDYVVAKSGIGELAPFYKNVIENIGGIWTGEMNSGTDSYCFTPDATNSVISCGFRIYSRGVGAGEEGLLFIKYER